MIAREKTAEDPAPVTRIHARRQALAVQITVEDWRKAEARYWARVNPPSIARLALDVIERFNRDKDHTQQTGHHRCKVQRSMDHGVQVKIGAFNHTNQNRPDRDTGHQEHDDADPAAHDIQKRVDDPALKPCAANANRKAHQRQNDSVHQRQRRHREDELIHFVPPLLAFTTLRRTRAAFKAVLRGLCALF